MSFPNLPPPSIRLVPPSPRPAPAEPAEPAESVKSVESGESVEPQNLRRPSRSVSPLSLDDSRSRSSPRRSPSPSRDRTRTRSRSPSPDPSPSRSRSRGRGRSHDRSSPPRSSRTSDPTSIPPSLPIYSDAKTMTRDYGAAHISLTRARPKPTGIHALIEHLTSAPAFPLETSPTTSALCKQWRWGQYRDAAHQCHHCGTALGWASEYASGETAEPYLDKALREPWTAAAALATYNIDVPTAMRMPGGAIRPDLTYGFTGAALTREQREAADALPAGTRVIEVGREPLFPFMAQRWVDDGGSRREAEREVAAAGVAAGKALAQFYRLAGAQAETVDAVFFSAVVSPEVCRVFVHWIRRDEGRGRFLYEMDQVCVALMEDEDQVERLRRVFNRIKDWAREDRLKRVKEVLDFILVKDAEVAKVQEEALQKARAREEVLKEARRREKGKGRAMDVDDGDVVYESDPFSEEEEEVEMEDIKERVEKMGVDDGQATPKASALNQPKRDSLAEP